LEVIEAREKAVTRRIAELVKAHDAEEKEKSLRAKAQ